MFTTANTPYSRFIALLDTPSKYEDGKILVFDAATKKITSYYAYELPHLDEAITKGLQSTFEESDTISADITDEKVQFNLKDESVTPRHVKTENNPFDRAVLICKDNKFYWSYVDCQVLEIEAKENITFLQPITMKGTVATYNQPLTNQCLGLALHDCQARDKLVVLVSGKLASTEWSWSTGTTIFLGDKTITNIPPTESGKFIQKIGVMLTENILYISPHQCILL